MAPIERSALALIEMSPQDAFTRIWEHYITQKGDLGVYGPQDVEPTELNFRRCVYRGPAGQRCPVGLLIPDDYYREDFESVSFSGRITELFAPNLHSLLGQIQTAHDGAVSHEFRADAARARFEAGLRRIAALFDLRIPC